MPIKESGSKYFEDAKGSIAKVRGKKLSETERESEAIALAANMLLEAERTMTLSEKSTQAELHRLMHDRMGKAFTTLMTDQCFRSHRPARVADQLVYLLDQLGLPTYLHAFRRFSLGVFKLFGKPLSFIFVPMTTFLLRHATARVILPGEPTALKRHMHLRRQQGVRLNLNHLGEAILGEEEAKRRLHVYLHDLKQDDI
jgi:RHH-type proline utilization regulon transcriptional repressor/proline dehydrogenase/delta 1-pyrroline-5-carboxylate dehydrogenase